MLFYLGQLLPDLTVNYLFLLENMSTVTSAFGQSFLTNDLYFPVSYLLILSESILFLLLFASLFRCTTGF